MQTAASGLNNGVEALCAGCLDVLMVVSLESKDLKIQIATLLPKPRPGTD